MNSRRRPDRRRQTAKLRDGTRTMCGWRPLHPACKPRTCRKRRLRQLSITSTGSPSTRAKIGRISCIISGKSRLSNGSAYQLRLSTWRRPKGAEAFALQCACEFRDALLNAAHPRAPRRRAAASLLRVLGGTFDAPARCGGGRGKMIVQRPPSMGSSRGGGAAMEYPAEPSGIRGSGAHRRSSHAYVEQPAPRTFRYGRPRPLSLHASSR